MTKPAAIAAQLVDIRNVGQHKCIKLTVHVPVEQAALITDAFGWPTMVDPVPVALARLNPDTGIRRPVREADADLQGQDGSASRTHERRPFASLPLPQQAALLCNDPVFRAFLNEEFGYDCKTSDDAAEAVRERCNVGSRSEIKSNTPAADKFVSDRERFIAWKLVSA